MSTLSMQRPEAIAAEVAYKLRAFDAGVVVCVSRGFGHSPQFVIWAIGPDGQIYGPTLDAHHTDAARLTAHVRGFMENHTRAWAAKTTGADQ